MRRRVPRRVRHLASILYANNYAEACRQEVEVRFDTTFDIIINTWSLEKLRDVDDWLDKRVVEQSIERDVRQSMRADAARRGENT